MCKPARHECFHSLPTVYAHQCTKSEVSMWSCISLHLDDRRNFKQTEARMKTRVSSLLLSYSGGPLQNQVLHNSIRKNKLKTLLSPNIGLQVWLMTSRQTDPDISSTFGWNMRFSNPIEGDLKGYSFGSVTCTFHTPPAYGAAKEVATNAR